MIIFIFLTGQAAELRDDIRTLGAILCHVASQSYLDRRHERDGQQIAARGERGPGQGPAG